eukprot:570119-Pleurochrysis_carterae.AAC.2
MGGLWQGLQHDLLSMGQGHDGVSGVASLGPSSCRYRVLDCTNKVSNCRRQSWYVHYLVWIVPRQIFEYGNLRKFFLCAIESGGAQLKKFARKTVCWRHPLLQR